MIFAALGFALLLKGRIPPLGVAAIAIAFGATLCLVCDLAARTLFSPYELPVGIVLSFLGAPFFLYLLLIRKKRSRHDAD